MHGLHVIAGVSFLILCYIRITIEQVTTNHHMSYMFAIYYWHLVDVVWLLVYLLAYIFGGRVLVCEGVGPSLAFFYGDKNQRHIVHLQGSRSTVCFRSTDGYLVPMQKILGLCT